MTTYIIRRRNQSAETAIVRPSLHWPDCVGWAMENRGKWLAQTATGYRAGNMPCAVFGTEEEALSAVREAHASAETPGPQHPSYWAYYSAPNRDPSQCVLGADYILSRLLPADATVEGPFS